MRCRRSERLSSDYLFWPFCDYRDYWRICQGRFATMPSDYWTASDYLATIASGYPATIRHTRGRGSLGGAAPVFVPWGRVWPGLV